jgi:hypothetical protein
MHALVPSDGLAQRLDKHDNLLGSPDETQLGARSLLWSSADSCA